MTKLAELYVEQLAEGILPDPNSDEARAYGEYSAQYEKCRRNQIASEIVRESCLKVFGADWYLLGSASLI